MNQKPESGPSGVSEKRGRAGEPTLRHVVSEDLADASRLCVLHGQAIKAGFISQSECDRLRFFAAAEHAKAIGTKNPCGLFAVLVRKRLWHFITQDDEEIARRTLQKLDLMSPVRISEALEEIGSDGPHTDQSGDEDLSTIREIIAQSLEQELQRSGGWICESARAA